jgi:hypothetical protein
VDVLQYNQGFRFTTEEQRKHGTEVDRDFVGYLAAASPNCWSVFGTFCFGNPQKQMSAAERVVRYDWIVAVEKVSESNFERTPFRRPVYDELWKRASGILNDTAGDKLPLKVVLTDATCVEMITIAKISSIATYRESHGPDSLEQRCSDMQVTQFQEFVRGPAALPSHAIFEVLQPLRLNDGEGDMSQEQLEVQQAAVIVELTGGSRYNAVAAAATMKVDAKKVLAAQIEEKNAAIAAVAYLAKKEAEMSAAAAKIAAAELAAKKKAAERKRKRKKEKKAESAAAKAVVAEAMAKKEAEMSAAAAKIAAVELAAKKKAADTAVVDSAAGFSTCASFKSDLTQYGIVLEKPPLTCFLLWSLVKSNTTSL